MAKRGRKRAAPEQEEQGGVHSVAESSKRRKKGRQLGQTIPNYKPKPEPEYFNEKRNLEDLWQAAFPVGTEWHNMDKLREINWNFTNLEDAFEEGGVLHGKKVYLFGGTEPQLLNIDGKIKVTFVPFVVAVDSPFPPSDKIGISSVQRGEDILPMKQMKMDWIPYVPLKNRLSGIERLKAQIFCLGCTQRRSTLKLLTIERVKQYDYCLPYFPPLEPQRNEEDTVVNLILFPIEPPIVGVFDWELDDLEDFTNEHIEDETLPKDKKDEFKNYLREQVRERRASQRKAREARRRMIEDMNPDVKAAYEKMKFYKFYPVSTPEMQMPDFSSFKDHFKINRYYPNAHQVFF